MLLLAEGQIITPAFLQQLKTRGVLTISIHESEVPRICAGEPQGTAVRGQADRDGVFCPLHNDGTDLLDDVIRNGQLGMPTQGEAFGNSLERHGATSYSDQLKEEIASRRCAETLKIQSVFQGLTAGRGLDVQTLTAVTDAALDDMVRDADLFACIGVNPFAEGYPARHSLHVSMLATLIGNRLQFDRQTLKELAIGCLIHDSGMLKVDKRLYDAGRMLSAIEFLEITKHPVVIFDMIKDMRAVSNRSAMIAYQIHERCNGSGYPRRRESARIHFLSKLAGVADAYVGLVSPRPYRQALQPYRAMETMLKGVKLGLYDGTAVKALLYALSLFPIGSYVQLNDGRVARVLRTPGAAYTRPVIEAWRASRLDAPADIIDLSQAADLSIVRSLPSLE